MESGHVMYNKTAGRENNDRDLSWLLSTLNGSCLKKTTRRSTHVCVSLK